MIHTARFEDDLQHAPGRKSLSVILDAMLVATLRFVDRDKYHLSAGDVQRLIEEKRDSVILSAMSSMSVQSLQALIILTFTTVSSAQMIVRATRGYSFFFILRWNSLNVG